MNSAVLYAVTFVLMCLHGHLDYSLSTCWMQSSICWTHYHFKENKSRLLITEKETCLLSNLLAELKLVSFQSMLINPWISLALLTQWWALLWKMAKLEFLLGSLCFKSYHKLTTWKSVSSWLQRWKLDDTKLMRQALSAYWLLLFIILLTKRSLFSLVKKKKFLSDPLINFGQQPNIRLRCFQTSAEELQKSQK